MSESERKRERLNLIFNMLSEGACIDDIDTALGKMERVKIYSIGRQTETHAKVLLRGAFRVTEVQKAGQEDEGRGIDYWVTLGFKQGDLQLPAQIKSSEKDVIVFKQSQKYLDLDKKILVLHTGVWTSKTKFKQQFCRELRRVLEIINQESCVIPLDRQLTYR